jgi:hypothetical protein
VAKKTTPKAGDWREETSTAFDTRSEADPEMTERKWKKSNGMAGISLVAQRIVCTGDL